MYNDPKWRDKINKHLWNKNHRNKRKEKQERKYWEKVASDAGESEIEAMNQVNDKRIALQKLFL